MFIFDAHCDSISCPASAKVSLNTVQAGRQFDFASAIGVTNLQIMGIFIDEDDRQRIQYPHFIQLYQKLIDDIQNNKQVHLITDGAKLQHREQHPFNVIIAVEGGEIIGEDLGKLDEIFNLGVRAMTLTWNNDNAIASGCQSGHIDLGLTNFGQQVIKRMNELGMVIDIAHLAPRGVNEVLLRSQQPVMVSHGNCYGLHAHPRNVTDETIKAIAQGQGVIGVTYVPEFLKEPYHLATIDDVVNHIAYIADLVGTAYVGLGSDFDGITHPLAGLSHVSQVPDLIEKLKLKGFYQQEIEQIMGGNFLRLFQQVMQ